MCEVDDLVCYTRDHWDWLKSAGLVVQHCRRRDFTGRILRGNRSGVVIVEWDDGRPWPRRYKKAPQSPSHHLAANLTPAN